MAEVPFYVARAKLAGLSNHPDRKPEALADARADFVVASVMRHARKVGLASLPAARRTDLAALILAEGVAE